MESAHYIPYARQALNYPVITSYKTRYEKLSHNGSSNQVSPRWQKYYIVTDLLTDLLHSTGCITWHRCIYIYIYFMMTSSNGNIFRFIGHLSGDSPVTGEFLAQRPVTRSFDVFFDLLLNKRLRKQTRGWWFETPSRPLWRHYNVLFITITCIKLPATYPNTVQSYHSVVRYQL